ncbi:curli assembly protein CsgF [Caulobacter segnis]
MKTSSSLDSLASPNRTLAPVTASISAYRGRSAAAAVIGLVMATAAGPVQATDLHYNMLSPSFGGTNPVALQMAQFDRSLQAARDAAAAAAAKAAIPPDPNAPFVNAIVSQLNGLVARSIAQKIANSAPGTSGSVHSGNVTITYTNSDGQLNITITSPTGSTTLTVPSGG